MEPSAFIDKAHMPDEQDLPGILGRSASLWSELEELIASRFEPLSREWVFGGAKYGWSLRLKHKKRAVLYMTPLIRHFRVGFALGEKAVSAAYHSELSEAVLELIDEAPKYAEGRAVRMEVRRKSDLRDVVKIAEIKMAN